MKLIPVPTNKPLLDVLPIVVFTMPLEVLAHDRKFLESGALEELNDVRQPAWRDDPSKISYRGSFNVMGRVGHATHWGVRAIQTPAIWLYLMENHGLKDGDFYMFTNALPSFVHELNVVSMAKAAATARGSK